MRIRRNKGSAIVEFIVALVIFLPILISILLAAVEVGTAYSLYQNVDTAARQAAKDMATAYQSDPTIIIDTTKQQAVLTRIRIPNVVADNAQFSDPVWDLNYPASVTISCRFTSGQYGLPVFPQSDPLHLAGRFNCVSASTFRIQ